MDEIPSIEIAGVEFEYVGGQVFIKDISSDYPSIPVEDLPQLIRFLQWVYDPITETYNGAENEATAPIDDNQFSTELDKAIALVNEAARLLGGIPA